ncbi:MAG: FAD:protein FMN transferase [Gammaproteobacteria bacterium]|nr:MAG: FAD:protein FMN transferase [Gammaproteobacteria bacterium]
MNIMRRRQFITPVLLLFASLSSCTPPPPANIYQETVLSFGTIIDITIVGVDRTTADTAFSSLQDDFAYMQVTWHAWRPGGLSRTNYLLSLGRNFSLVPSIQPLIEASTDLSAKSQGLFNPAIGKLIALWGFQSDEEPARPPRPDEVARLVALNPEMSDILYDGQMTIRSRNTAVQIDLGAFAKGFGIDMAIAHLQELGVKNAIINAGGDMRAIGNKNGKPWHIGIRNPISSNASAVIASIDLRAGEAIVTSGDYERYFEYEGKRYHHIIDPRTGYPARGTRSVTVIHSSAAVADAAATALFVAGPGQWHEIARSMDIKFVMLIDENNRIHMNPAMARRMKLTASPEPKIILSEPL